MIKKIVIEFETGSEDRVTDKVFETAIKHIRRSGGKVIGMKTEDAKLEENVRRRNDFRIPDLIKERERADLRLVIGNYKREKGIGCDVEELSERVAYAFRKSNL